MRHYQRRGNPAMPTVLIELPGGAGVVCRHDGEIVITQVVLLPSGACGVEAESIAMWISASICR